MDWMDGLDGSLGLVEYRAPYGANNPKRTFNLEQIIKELYLYLCCNSFVDILHHPPPSHRSGGRGSNWASSSSSFTVVPPARWLGGGGFRFPGR